MCLGAAVSGGSRVSLEARRRRSCGLPRGPAGRCRRPIVSAQCTVLEFHSNNARLGKKQTIRYRVTAHSTSPPPGRPRSWPAQFTVPIFEDVHAESSALFATAAPLPGEHGGACDQLCALCSNSTHVRDFFISDHKSREPRYVHSLGKAAVLGLLFTCMSHRPPIPCAVLEFHFLT